MIICGKPFCRMKVRTEQTVVWTGGCYQKRCSSSVFPGRLTVTSMKLWAVNQQFLLCPGQPHQPTYHDLADGWQGVVTMLFPCGCVTAVAPAGCAAVRRPPPRATGRPGDRGSRAPDRSRPQPGPALPRAGNRYEVCSIPAITVNRRLRGCEKVAGARTPLLLWAGPAWNTGTEKVSPAAPLSCLAWHRSGQTRPAARWQSVLAPGGPSGAGWLRSPTCPSCNAPVSAAPAPLSVPSLCKETVAWPVRNANIPYPVRQAAGVPTALRLARGSACQTEGQAGRPGLPASPGLFSLHKGPEALLARLA